ncbi:MAG: DUF2892 domain-containing protein [Ignavibacteriaceae bacterium]|nr:DUF2892 domain-containing protein [Ignavibacteriaceae bacterium]
MVKNVGSKDKIVRILISIVLTGAGIYFQTWFALLGVLPIFSVVTGWCPLYSIFGVNICKISGREK